MWNRLYLECVFYFCFRSRLLALFLSELLQNLLQWGVQDWKHEWLTFQWRRCLFQPGCFCFSPLGVTSAMNMQWPLSMSWWGRESFIDSWAHSSLCSETKRRWSLRGAQWRLWSHMKASRVNPLAMACGEFWLPSYTTGKAFIGHTHLEKKKSPFGICYNLKKYQEKCGKFGMFLSISQYCWCARYCCTTELSDLNTKNKCLDRNRCDINYIWIESYIECCRKMERTEERFLTSTIYST